MNNREKAKHAKEDVKQSEGYIEAVKEVMKEIGDKDGEKLATEVISATKKLCEHIEEKLND